MNKYPARTLSILICVYNEEKTIDNKIRNILAVDKNNEITEIIIVDDNSFDKTPEVVTNYSKMNEKIVLIKNIYRKGKIGAVVTGLKHARSEIVCVTDVDAFFEEDTLGNALKLFDDPLVGADTDDLGIIHLHLDNQRKKDSWLKLINYGIQESGQLVSINVNASELCFERRWPAENFIVLISILASKYPDIKFIFIGSRVEKEYVDNIFSQLSPKYRNVVNLAGELSLEELLVLLGDSLLFLGNDSGPLHLAEALETPSVSLFGPETPSLYGPRDAPSILSFTRDSTAVPA